MEDERSKLQGELVELKARRESIPFKILALDKQFNAELTYGDPKEAYEHRAMIQALKEESKFLLYEIKKVELDIEEIDHRGEVNQNE